jgi:hypothetical protein
MQLIFDCFYASRKKRRLYNYHIALMGRQGLLETFSIEHFYIDFIFLFFFSLYFLLNFLFSFLFYISLYLLKIISWKFVLFFYYVSIIWEVWEFLLYCELVVLWGILPGISYKECYQQKYQAFNIKDVLVKEDDFLELMRSQDSVFIKYVNVIIYNWKYLIIERNCELAASFGVFYIDFFYFLFFIFGFFSFFFFFFFIGWKNYFFYFAVQQVLKSSSLLDHKVVAKIGCLNTFLPMQR